MVKILARTIALFAIVVLPAGSCAATSAPAPEAATGPVTVPMELELNRPYIDVTLTGPNGQSVTAHAYVDTGGGALILTSGLARRLGLEATSKERYGRGDEYAPTTVPVLRIGGHPVELADARALIDTKQPQTLGQTDAMLALPARFLRHYAVVFDYPAGTFTLADPQQMEPAGTAVKTSIGQAGMPVVWLSVDGKRWGFLMDTGGQASMISTARLDAWAGQHPDWPHVAGAYGPANMLLGDKAGGNLHMLRVGSMQWGPFTLRGVNAVSRPAGTYEGWMTDLLGQPVIGSIGGNVLRHFKVTVDYPASTVYLERATTERDTPLRMVGIMLQPTGDGGYAVGRVLPFVHQVKAGDRLLRVDGHAVNGVPFAKVVRWLSGPPDQSHALVLKRNGQVVTTEASVTTILWRGKRG